MYYAKYFNNYHESQHDLERVAPSHTSVRKNNESMIKQIQNSKRSILLKEQEEKRIIIERNMENCFRPIYQHRPIEAKEEEEERLVGL